MSCPDLVGWQLLHKLIERDIANESDIIVAITHWFLIKKGGFLCLGLGDQVSRYFAIALNVECLILLPVDLKYNCFIFELCRKL